MIFEIEQSLEYRFAEQRIGQYASAVNDDPIIQEHHEAMDCRDCEDFLAIGINAYKRIEKFECLVRGAVSDGLLEWCDTYDDVLMHLHRAWLEPCQRADDRIKRLATGFRPDNLDEFEDIRAQVLDRLDQQDLIQRSKKDRRQLFASEPW